VIPGVEITGVVISGAVAAQLASSASASAEGDPGSAVQMVSRRSAWPSVGRSRVQ